MTALPARASILCLAIASVVFMGPPVPSPLPSMAVHVDGSTGLGGLRPGEFRVVPPGEPGPLPRREVGAEPIAFRPSGTPTSSRERKRTPRVQAFLTGTTALEPTMGIDEE